MHFNHDLLQAVESLNDGVFIAENVFQDFVLTFANFSMAEFCQMQPKQMIGMHLNEVLKHVADEQKISEYLDKIYSGYTVEFERNTLNADGMQVWLKVSITSFYTETGQHLVIGFIKDETESRGKDHQIIQAQKLEAIGHLAGGIAHDFNNLLSIINGYACMAEKQMQRGEDWLASLKQIQQAVKRGSGLTKQLLTFGRHQVNQGNSINVAWHIRELEVLIKPLLPAGIGLKIHGDEDEAYISCSGDIITQIIMNLVINSRDAIGHHGSINLDWLVLPASELPHKPAQLERAEGNYVCINVSDSGQGISADNLSKIFDPFFTTKEQGKGTGLGLSVVYGLVKQLKGVIDVSSIIGEGTVFSVYLPLSTGSVTKSLSENAFIGDTDDASILKGKTILVTEDEVDLRELIRSQLSEQGMNVLLAADGNEALMIQDEADREIDILLTDIVMPNMNGLKLAELFKEISPETKVIFMSGYSMKGDAALYTLPTDAVYLEKPVMPNDLINNLIAVLSNSRGEAHN